MTRTSKHGAPGTFLLKIAHLLFDEAVIADVVVPTIADLQREVATAFTLRDRLAARWRGYGAFWMLAAVAPVVFLGWRPVRPAPPASPVGGIALGMLLVLLFTPASLRGWLLASLLGGTIFAVIIHAWHARHPTHVPLAPGENYRRPEINLSSIPVQANIGGLIFMVGSVFIVIAGLPSWHWFFVAAAAGGLLTGALLFAWHARHPARGLPENHISLR
jgi:hypothetical protein